MGMTIEEKREYNRKRMAEWRARKKSGEPAPARKPTSRRKKKGRLPDKNSYVLVAEFDHGGPWQIWARRLENHHRWVNMKVIARHVPRIGSPSVWIAYRLDDDKKTLAKNDSTATMRALNPSLEGRIMEAISHLTFADLPSVTDVT